MRFLGTIDSKTDAKGRVFLPASFRKVLSTAGAERLVLRKDIFQPCLVLYPESVWNQMLDSLRARLNRWNRQDQMVFRQFVSDVEPVALDGNGRFLIPPPLPADGGHRGTGALHRHGRRHRDLERRRGRGSVHGRRRLRPGAGGPDGSAFPGAAESENDSNQPRQ